MFGKKSLKLEPLTPSESGLGTAPKAEDSIIKEINVHKMPHGYKSGAFSYDDYFSSNAPQPAGAINTGNKDSFDTGKKMNLKMPLIIGGIVLVLGGGYFLLDYLKPNFFSEIFSSIFKKTEVVKTITPAPSEVVKIEAPTVVETTTLPEITTTTEEIVIVTTTPEVVTTTPVASVADNSLLSVDSDSDGLNDQEELALGTDLYLPDTNGNGYGDLTEALNLYNPVGTGKIDANSNMAKFTSSNYKYSVYYPKKWTLEAVDKDANVIITAIDGSFVQIMTQNNDKKQKIKDWYQTEFNQAVELNQLTKIAGLDVVRSTDGLFAYVVSKDLKYVYIFSYTLDEGQQPLFSNIFEVILKSLNF
jgi:hypothetical protein